MKDLFFIFVIILMAVPTLKAQERPTTATAMANDRYFYAGLGTGVDLPGSGWDPDFYMASGVNGLVGYQFDKNWAAQLNVDEWFFTGGGNSLYNLRLLGEVKYVFAGPGWQPYLLAGAGTVFQSDSVGDVTTNFDVLGGVGAQFDLFPRAHFFVEAKYNLILSQDNSFTDLPLNAGLWFEF